MPEPQSQDMDAAPDSGPFSLNDGTAYRRWRAHKLGHYPRAMREQCVPIAHLGQLTEAERDAITTACRRANFALYWTDPQAPPTKDDLRAFGDALGLRTFDQHLWAPPNGIAELRCETFGGRGEYIPYTDQAMNWHTDGYYNTQEAAVHGVIMHCVSPAAAGGSNWLLDPEMVYIALRDANPKHVETLMQPDAMTIPANLLNPEAGRPEVTGPVFSVNPDDGALHMRYTARTRSIRWKNDASTRSAVALLEELLTPPVPYAFHVFLQSAQGIVCNNVLHDREAFYDDPASGRERLVWRARYRERIADPIAHPLEKS